MPLISSGSRLIRHQASGNGLLNNLVAYWGLDEAGGANNALDKHTNGLTLTHTASPGSDTGKVYAGARTFNGSSQYFSRASETALSTGNIDFALAAWVYPTASDSTRTIIGKWRFTASANREWLFRVNGGVYEFRVSSDGATSTVITGGAPSLNAWSLVIAWHDATADTINLCVNNGTPASAAHTTGAYQSNAPVSISTYDDGSGAFWWVGRLGPIAYWKNRTLDTTARTALYNAGAGLAYASFTA